MTNDHRKPSQWAPTWAGWFGTSIGIVAVSCLVCWPRPTLYVLGTVAVSIWLMVALLWALRRAR